MGNRTLITFLSRPDGRLVLRNFSAVAVANTINRVLKFLYLLYLARVLDTETFGTVSFGYRAALVFVGIADLGLSLQGSIEVARHKENAGEYIGSIGVLKLGFSVLACVLFVIFGLIMGSAPLQQRIIILFVPLVVFSDLAFNWPLQGLEQMHHVAISRVLNGVLEWVLIILLVTDSSKVLWAPVTMGVASFASVMYLIILTMAQPGIRWGWSRSTALSVLKVALPLGLSIMVLRLYNNSDIVLLGILATEEDAGLYQSAYMIPQFVWSLCMVLMTAVIPPLARLANHSFAEAKAIVRTMALLALGVMAPISLVGIVFAPQLMKLLYGGDYVRGALALQLLLVALPLGMARIIAHRALPVFNWHKWFLLVVALQLAVNAVLNLSLIGTLGYVGPALAMVVSEAVGLLALGILFRRRSMSAGL